MQRVSAKLRPRHFLASQWTFWGSQAGRLQHSMSSNGSGKVGLKILIAQLLRHFKQTAEVREYLKHYSSQDMMNFAVIKVSGDVLHNITELQQCASALSFLHRVGLVPIVVHGAGFFTGRRTWKPTAPGDADSFELGVDYMKNANASLVYALQAMGTEAVGFTEDVFFAQPTADERPYVGQIDRMDITPVAEAVHANCIPVIASLGRSVEDNRLLTFSTAQAAQHVIQQSEPLKIIIIREEGGLRDAAGNTLRLLPITQAQQSLGYEAFNLLPDEEQTFSEVQQLFGCMPFGCTIAVTKAGQLAQELFTHKGAGTLVKRTEQINRFTSLDDVDIEQLRSLLEDSFGKRLRDGYFEDLAQSVRSIYLAESGRGGAIVTNTPMGISYLDKFAVLKSAQGDQLGVDIWRAMVSHEPQLCWRSRADNVVNSWYFERSHGSFKGGEASKWVVFWRGIEQKDIDDVIEFVLGVEPTFA